MPLNDLAKWSGFDRKPISERRKILLNHCPKIDANLLDHLLISKSQRQNRVFPILNMIENVVCTIDLPYAISPYFVINSVNYVVPMAIEEPSVVAACSSASKIIAFNGGFAAESSPNLMTGQICVHDIRNPRAGCEAISKSRAALIDAANGFCESMVKRGGGVIDIEPKIIRPRSRSRNDYLCVLVHMDVRECMGANKINTVCEGLSARISEITNGRTGARILTNLCSKRTSKVSFKVPVEKLKWKNFDGKFVAERILETHFFAVDDEQRAVTNNKGIMNGIDAAAIAAGQDWRAIESAAHAFAAFKENADSKYSPLADYAIVSDGGREYLEGKLEMPISVGVVGGSVRTHPTFRMSHQILGNVSASELAQILLAVGLSANLAALRALATEGIQKGHMALHNRSVSMSRKGFGLDEENVLSK